MLLWSIQYVAENTLRFGREASRLVLEGEGHELLFSGIVMFICIRFTTTFLVYSRQVRDYLPRLFATGS